MMLKILYCAVVMQKLHSVVKAIFCYRDNYLKRFPELESLVPTPIEYIRTIKELRNDLERCKNNEVLQQVGYSIAC